MVYRISTHDSSKHTPFFLLYGRDPILPMDTLLRPKLRYMGDDYVPTMLQRLHVAYNHTRENTIETREKNKRIYNKRADTEEFKPGDAVYYHHIAVKPGETSKLDSPFRPYYRVIEKTSPVNYRVELLMNYVQALVHSLFKLDKA